MEMTTSLSSLESIISSEPNETLVGGGEDGILLLPQKISVPITFAVIFVVGILGNAILIVTVVRNKAMRTPPNVLIINMALGDFVLLFISVPVASTIYTFDRWDFGNAVCKINEFLQMGVSIFTLVALCVDRFVAIVFPLTSYSSRSVIRVVAVSVLIWAASVGLGLMDLVGAHTEDCSDCEPIITICSLYPVAWGPECVVFRIIFRFVVFFVLPMVIIVIIYVLIAFVLLRQSRVLTSVMGQGSPTPTPQSSNGSPRVGSEAAAVLRQIESRKKIAKVVLSFVVIFVVCWLPRHVYVMCFHLRGLTYNPYWHVFKTLGFCLMFIYSAVNPLALYFLNDEYRRYYRHYLCGTRRGGCSTGDAGEERRRKEGFCRL